MEPGLISLTVLLAGAAVDPAAPVFVRIDQSLQVRVVGELSDRTEVRWYHLLPEARDYDNSSHCGMPAPLDCHDPIQWSWHEDESLRGQLDLDWTTHSLLHSPGTHRLAVSMGPISTAPEPDKTMELVVRPHDGYTGFVRELIGLPFVFWPKPIPGGHQTDLRLGADCVATLIYGQRRMGHAVPYVAPGALEHFTELVPAEAPIREGDLLHFGFQTAVLVTDGSPVGVLDDGDQVVHAHHALVEEVPFGSLSYKGQPHTVRRWSTSLPSPSP